MSWTSRLTQTLGLDAIARTLRFAHTGCCPVCRLVQPVSRRCSAGCDAQPRRILAADESFFEPLPTKLIMVPEDAQNLRAHRVVLGLLGYGVALLAVGAIAISTGNLAMFGAGAILAVLVPLGISMAPGLKRGPSTISSQLSPAPRRHSLPPPSQAVVEGEAHPLSKQRRSFIDKAQCLACALVGINSRGQVVVRAAGGESFKLETDVGVVVVLGPVELVGPFSASAGTLEEADVKLLGLRHCELAQIGWRERVVVAGTRVRVHGEVVKRHVPELSPYREQLGDVIEASPTTIVEILG